MSLPICPKCRSDRCLPDPSNGGAGRNVCHACGFTGPVREFHPITGHEAVEYFADKLKEHYRNNPIAFADYYMQQTKPLPEGVSMDKKTGILHTDKTPAPIKQYKDD